MASRLYSGRFILIQKILLTQNAIQLWDGGMLIQIKFKEEDAWPENGWYIYQDVLYCHYHQMIMIQSNLILILKRVLVIIET